MNSTLQNIWLCVALSLSVLGCGTERDRGTSLAANRTPATTSRPIVEELAPHLKAYLSKWAIGQANGQRLRVDLVGNCIGTPTRTTGPRSSFPVSLSAAGLTISFPTSSGQVVTFPNGSGLVVEIPGSAGLQVEIPGTPPIDLSGSIGGSGEPETTVSIPGASSGVPSVVVSFPQGVSGTVTFPPGGSAPRPNIKVNCRPPLRSPVVN